MIQYFWWQWQPTYLQREHDWHGHWWSQSHDDDTQTYMVLSSPDLLSSTSPLSPSEYQSVHLPDKHQQCTAESALHNSQRTEYLPQDTLPHLNRPQITSNTFCKAANRSTQVHTIRKYTYSNTDSTEVEPSNTEDIYTLASSDNEGNKVGLKSSSTNTEPDELYGEKHFCNTVSLASFVADNLEYSELPQTRQCPAELLLHQTEKRSEDKSIDDLRSCTKTTVTPSHSDAVLQPNCVYASLLDDPDSSYNPSPELDSAVTLESISDDQMKPSVEQVATNESDADRKDSNSSNITNISSITTTSNVSISGNITDSSSTSGPASSANIRKRTCSTDQFSLIENYPPKERRKLKNELKENSAGSDTSGSGPSPPLVRAPPSSALYRGPPTGKLSRQNSLAGIVDVRHHKHTVSLTHLDDTRQQSAKTTKRSAITP